MKAYVLKSKVDHWCSLVGMVVVADSPADARIIAQQKADDIDETDTNWFDPEQSSCTELNMSESGIVAATFASS